MSKTTNIAAQSARREVGRQRLQELAAKSAEASASGPVRELERLRVYLLDWAQHQQRQRGVSGVTGSMLADYMKSGNSSATELVEQSDGWAMSIIDASIDDLSTVMKPDGVLARAALRVRYLNEGLAPGGEIKIRVFRSGRLHAFSLLECDALADRAENALIPIVKRKGLPL